MNDTLKPTRIMLDGMDETPIAIPFPFKIGKYIIRDPDEWNQFRQHYAELEALTADRLILLKRVDKEIETMYRLRIIYPASLGDLWTDIVSEMDRSVNALSR